MLINDHHQFFLCIKSPEPQTSSVEGKTPYEQEETLSRTSSRENKHICRECKYILQEILRNFTYIINGFVTYFQLIKFVLCCINFGFQRRQICLLIMLIRILGVLMDKAIIYSCKNTKAESSYYWENVCSLKWTDRNCYRNRHGSFKYWSGWSLHCLVAW